jgi:Tol biopolymer transport system component
VLTTGAGPELGPSLSPDGRFVAYSARSGGDWDVFLLRVGGERPISLTGESGFDDLQPAFSPDGEQIAFRSARSGGGLFLMGATGESVRRLVDFGWNPSWSPDGREIVFATLPVFHSPLDRPARSELWTVEVASGRTRRISPGDAVQPSWSPGGHRIAYWGLPEGGSQRDIWTIPASGGAPMAVTRDEAVDWNPVWSPDGAWLYFSSDRGGSMNLWRIAIDEVSGAVRSPPERVTTPATYAHDLAFSRDGSRLAYVSTLVEQELLRIPIDPGTGKIDGAPEAVVRDLRGASFPQVSPDGRWLAYSRSLNQEDIVLSRLDGSEQRALTDDAARDRFPRWSPDGERVAFYSDRDGGYEVWSVHRDGSDLRRLTLDPERGSARFAIWSPDGERLLYSRRQITGLIVDPDAGPEAPPLDELPPLDPEGGAFFVAMAWSPDGRRIAGTVRRADGRRAGIVLFDLETRRYERLLEYGVWPSWLPDSRRLLFHAAPRSEASSGEGYPPGDHLFLVDRETREVVELLGSPGSSLDEATVAFDGRWIACVRTSVRADIWTLARDEP